MTFSNPESNSAFTWIHPQAKIHPSAQLDPFCVVHADVEIGEGSKIGSHVVLYDGVRIGKDCRILPGTVISSDARQLEFWRGDSPSGGLSPNVLIGDHVQIGAGCALHGGIVIGDHSWIASNCTIHDGARIGQNCRIFPGAVISAIPQDLKFKGEKTTLEIGDYTVVRECATLNRGTDYRSKTVVGDRCLIMAYAHVAHDCVLGNQVILANAVNMAGHVEVGDFAIIGGMSAIHQFVKIGRHCMISGGSMVGKDVPPYVKAGRQPLQYEGINSVGMRRRGFDSQVIHNIQDIYRCIFLSGMNTSRALDYAEAHLSPTEERDEIISFIRNATRGIIRSHLNGKDASEAELDSDH
ncbi:MAG: acyl-ACP--UDP-N-acetylglucosamine O-acyltransferase [Bacteroidetes bacterium]|nr:MAG: acyl-ACP--UDP-N-acetylglucosamine O-acyltransferase [Bacteroidota bacterium]